MSARFSHWLTSRLIGAARRLLPPERRDWADAMRAEMTYLPDGTALQWALGCLIAAIKQRFTPMHTGNLNTSRWVMFIETLGCFGPATLAWYEWTFGWSGVVRLNAEIIDKYFLSAPGGGYVLGLMIGFAVSGLIGPIGLWLGLRYVFLGRALRNRALGFTLIAGVVLQSLAGAVGTLWVGTGDFATSMQLFVLLTSLPIVGMLHLMYLGRAASSPLPPGASMAAS